MKRHPITLLCVLLLFAFAAAAAEVVQNGVVYFEEGRFAGWPANNGMWSWGDEIVVGFTLGYYEKNPQGGHDISRDKPSVHRQARSSDGGTTWGVETPSYLQDNGEERAAQRLEKPIEFTRPDFAAKFKGGQFYYTYDRCRVWEGPFDLPDFNRRGLLARTDYIVEGKHTLTAFIAAEKDSGGEGWPCCIRTEDGGLTWSLVGWIGQQPPAAYGYAIMPATVAIDNHSYLSMIRRGGVFDGTRRWWVEPFLSPDRGKSWYLLDAPVIDNAGNPATLTRLQDGRIAMTYGWRSAPYGIRARVSNDNGQTWGEEVILRGDAASWDIGYPRTVQRSDGMCVTTYYYHTPDRPERYIACTIWDPGWQERMAGRIYDAWRDGEPMPQMSAAHPDATLKDGYLVQQGVVRRMLENDTIGGFKAAAVSAAAQEKNGGPIAGVMPASGILRAEDDVVIDLGDYPGRKLETEIGYVFGEPITSPLADIDALRQHVAAVVPMIEVPGGLTEQTAVESTAADTAAWNGNAKALIVGDEREPAAIDTDAVAITLKHNGEVVNTAQGSDAGGGQWTTLLKSVNAIVEQGYVIQKGHVLTNGALGSILDAKPGRYLADFGELGQIAFRVK